MSITFDTILFLLHNLILIQFAVHLIFSKSEICHPIMVLTLPFCSDGFIVNLRKQQIFSAQLDGWIFFISCIQMFVCCSNCMINVTDRNLFRSISWMDLYRRLNIFLLNWIDIILCFFPVFFFVPLFQNPSQDHNGSQQSLDSLGTRSRSLGR